MYKVNEKKVIIYAAGTVGKLLLSILEKEGIEVYRFVDVRYEKIKELDGIKVESLEWLDTVVNKNDYCVIVTVKNVFEHTEIAKKIFSYGFYNIIYKPISVLNGEDSSDEMNRISRVHEILTDEDRIPAEGIPTLKNVSVSEYYDRAIIRQGNEPCLVHFPVEMIFTNYEPNSPWCYKNIFACYPAIDMYRAFGQSQPTNYKKAIDEYITKVASLGALKENRLIDEAWYKNVVSGRYQVYQEMKKSLALNPGFFEKNSGRVVRLESGHFQLASSGKNRISTLISERMQYLPIEISNADYEIFINQEVCNKVVNYLETISEKVFAPISHPFFYRMQCQAPDYLYVWLFSITRLLSKYVYEVQKNVEFESYTVLDALNDDGTTGRFMDYIGYKVKRLFAETPLCTLLDQLFYRDIPMVSCYTDNKILLWDNRNDNEKLKVILEEDKPQICFVQSWTGRDEAVIYEADEYTFRTTVANSIWNGERVEIKLYAKKEAGDLLSPLF